MTKRTAKKSGTGIKSPTPGGGGLFHNLEIQFEKVYRQAVKDTQGKVSIKTHFRYRDSMKKFLSFCATRFRLQNLRNISDKHLEAYIDYRRGNETSEKTIKSDLAAVRFFHRYIEGARFQLSGNEKFGLASTPDGRADRAWSDGEYKKMIALAERLDRPEVALAMRLARYAGLRVHEITRLSRKDAEQALSAGMLHVKGKGGKERDIPLTTEAVAALKEACEMAASENDKLLVPPGEKTHLVIKRIQNFIRRHRDKVMESGKEVNITFHGLRHAYAREQFRVKVGELKKIRRALAEVSEKLGHNRPEVTRIYLGSDWKGKR